MYKIFITRNLPGNFDEKLSKKFQVEVYKKNQPIPRKELLRKIKGKEAVITLLTDRVDKEFFNAAGSNLKIVANYAVGYDNIDLNEAKARNVVITNTPGVLTEAVAEHTWALILSLSRRIIEADKFTKMGKYKSWDPNLFLGTQLEGKTLGIIGFGRIGKWVAQRAVGFEMNIVYYSNSRDLTYEKKFNAKYLPLEKLLQTSDIVSLHLPLTKNTHHLIDKNKLKKMKSSAYLINTARGSIVNEKDLIFALKNKKIAGAALDVFEHEPKVSHQLTKMNNVILTPHIASATIKAREQMAKLATQNVMNFAHGKKILNLVNK